MTLTALLCNSSSDSIVNKNKQGLTLAQAFSLYLDWIIVHTSKFNGLLMFMRWQNDT